MVSYSPEHKHPNTQVYKDDPNQGTARKQDAEGESAMTITNTSAPLI
ncbi:MAG: hypothetical protein P8179_01430 [Candidatus Thiodiazotropha sp.]